MSLRLAFTTGVVGIGLTAVVLANIKAAMSRYSATANPYDATCDEQKAAEISWSEKDANHILCSSGRLYRSTDNESAEESLVNRGDTDEITKLWMKEAPKTRGSELLREYFKGKEPKPVVYIGHVHKYNELDRKGLKDLVTDGFELRVWDNLSKRVKPCQYTACLQQYLELLDEETSDHPNSAESSHYTEDRVATISSGEDGTNHILTNEGRMYRGSTVPTGGDQTAVEVLIRQVDDPKRIKTLWIKQAPKYLAAKDLQNFFTEQSDKPVLYIGHIHKYTANDRQGLKNLVNDGFELKVWENASNNVKPRYTECVCEYLKLLKEEALTHPDKEPSDYTEDKVAVISCGEDRMTHLLTNKGTMYRNSYEPYQHAEVVLKKKERLAQNITKVWIKNSPCSKCAKILSEFFADSSKPVLYVGSIYQPDDMEDRKGLLSLIKEGFRIEVWETMNTFLYGEDSDKSEEYLRGLREEVACSSQLLLNGGRGSSVKERQHCTIL